MADQIQDNQNISIVEANNNLADKNGGPDNTSIADHSILSRGTVPGPSNYWDGAITSSLSVPLGSKKIIQFPRTI